MAPTDLEQLVDMGFDKERSEMAVKKTSGIQSAIDWLEKTQDTPIDELRAAANPSTSKDPETDASIEPAALKEGEVANSLICDECHKKFRSSAQAEYHATRTGHDQFSQSTEEIAPLTEEEKKQKLEELRQRMVEKKARQAIIDKEEQKKNEKIRMKSTREVQDLKEDMAKNEQIKAAAKKRQEKLDDAAAKKRIQEKIADDKEARRLKAEKEKAAREGRAVAEAEATPIPQAASSSGPRKEVTEARLRLNLSSGMVQKTFPAGTTLFEVALALEGENGRPVESFTQTFPKKTWSGSVDFGKTLKEAGLAPSAVLIVK